MFAIDPNLPDLLGSVLNYLVDCLPPPISSLLLALTSRLLAFLSSLLACVVALASSQSSGWNPQDILPPLITLLCAYLALLTVYRTTAWAIRTAFWFFKWGLILSVAFAGMGWYLRDTTGGQGIQLILDAMNSRVPKIAGDTGSASGLPRTRSNAKPPRAWDSFESHRRWRDVNQRHANGEVDPIKTIIDMAGGLFEQGGQWWKVAKSIVDEAQHGGRLKGQQERQDNREPRSRSR